MCVFACVYTHNIFIYSAEIILVPFPLMQINSNLFD